MTNNNAFTYYINPNGSGNPNGTTPPQNPLTADAVHNTSPAWVLTFLRWAVRDTLRTEATVGANGPIDYSTIVKPLVVENDCIDVSVSDSKSNLTPTLAATLLNTDVNYETALAPGDFVICNMLNWEADARRVATQATNKQPVNGVNDGFKGIYKIQSVRKVLVTDPVSGTKVYAVKITAFAFTEFNNTIYFNPYLIDQAEQNTILFQSKIGNDWSLLASHKGLTAVQDIIRALIESFIGSGLTDTGSKDVIQENKDQNPHFFMPTIVGQLLGVNGLQNAKDSYNYLFGIQQYSSAQSQNVAQGMNPVGVSQSATSTSRFMEIPHSPVDGTAISKPDYWNQVKVWSILNQFINSPLNEMYTCFRISPSGSVMPTVVLRQIPFTTDGFDTSGSNFNVTKFLSLPRWNIDPALALGFDLGKDEAARINFVQYFGRSTIGPDGYSISEEIAQQNYLYDKNDVLRNGLRPYIVSTQFDEPASLSQKYAFRSPGWAKIVGDALIGGHLKISGTINFVGIVEPIAVGDNLYFDGVVYHIEQITHTSSISREGIKTFRTTISVSNGVLAQDGSQDTLMYSEMGANSAYTKRTSDYQNSQILPGASESQDTLNRSANVDAPHADNSSFIQPNTNTAIDDSGAN